MLELRRQIDNAPLLWDKSGEQISATTADGRLLKRAGMDPTETFQHYQVLRRDDGALWELGRGAMGVTYKAFDVNLRCLVALKVINGAYLDHPIARQRFIREARAAAALRHRNIAHVYHLGMDAQSFFYAMEFIDGETLDSLVRARGPLPPETVLRIALQTARALAAAARQRLVHRDIKPTNLMILAEDEDGEIHKTVKVIDFGLARSAVRGDASTHLTMGGFVGTPQYASPEQLEEKNVDGRSDIYSLGATLWYLLAGRPPFTGTLTSLITQHLSKEPPWDQLAAVPTPIRELLGRMLQKNPDHRPQSASDLRREIENCLGLLGGTNIRGLDDGFIERFSPDSESGGPRPAAVLAGEKSANGKPGILTTTVGSLVGGRYQIVRLAGEGSTGRVFQAHDLRGEGQTVALKVLHPDSLPNQEDGDRLLSQAAKVQSAPHPCLLRLLACDGPRGSTYLVTEWSGGLTLVDLLRSRGRLTVKEALTLLKQAVAVTDFARTNGLESLELHLHQIFVVPTGTTAVHAPVWADGAAAEFLSKSPLAVDLRIDPLGLGTSDGDLATWAGELTLMPSAPRLSEMAKAGAAGSPENRYRHRLASLFYELVEGAPPSASQLATTAGGQPFTLPGLGEAGNATLRRAFFPDSGFGSDTEFFELLAKSAGFEPDGLCFRAPAEIAPVILPPPDAEGAATVDAPLSLMKETTVPLADPPAGGGRRRRLTPVVLQRQGDCRVLTINVRTAGLFAVVFAGLMLVVFLAWSRSQPVTVAQIPRSEPVAVGNSAVAPPREDSETRSKKQPALAEPPQTAARSEHPVEASSISNVTATSTAPPQPFSMDGSPARDWLEGTVLAQIDDAPGISIPYAPGFEPEQNSDDNSDEIQIPYAPGMNPDGQDDLLEKGSLEERRNADAAALGATPLNSKDNSRIRTSNAAGSRSHSHHRASPPPPRNVWQRLFGIKPKTSRSR